MLYIIFTSLLPASFLSTFFLYFLLFIALFFFLHHAFSFSMFFFALYSFSPFVPSYLPFYLTSCFFLLYIYFHPISSCPRFFLLFAFFFGPIQNLTFTKTQVYSIRNKNNSSSRAAHQPVQGAVYRTSQTDPKSFCGLLTRYHIVT